MKNRIGFSRVLAQARSLELADAKSRARAFSSQVREALATARRWSDPRLGELSVLQQRAFTGRNPRTGETVEIPAKSRVAFKPSKALLAALDGGAGPDDASELAALVRAILSSPDGQGVKVGGLGVFVKRHKTGRVGRNPQTGEEIRIEGRTLVTFTPSKKLTAVLQPR